MSQRKQLMEISYHTDDETGMYRIGEIDHGMYSGLVEEYLKKYGVEGRNEILTSLCFLAHNVIDMYNKISIDKDAGQNDCSKAP